MLRAAAVAAMRHLVAVQNPSLYITAFRVLAAPRLFATSAQPQPEEPPSVGESATAGYDEGAAASTPAPRSLKFGDGYIAPHAGLKGSSAITNVVGVVPADVQHVMSNPVYNADYVESVYSQHVRPSTLRQRAAFTAIHAMRRTFDLATGYSVEPGKMTEAKWLQRMLFLETVAGVPGMVAGMLRHLKSLRSMRADGGWINTLLQEAENERMHLLTFMQMRQPGPLFRAAVIGAQGLFFNVYFVAYLLSPTTCHSFIGYLEEEAVNTYTHALKCIDAGELWAGTPAPPIAIEYWKLSADASMRDVILAVRADEACHSHVNHTYAGMSQEGVSPFKPGAVHVS